MKNLTWQNPEQLFVAQVLINKVKSKCCGIKVLKLLKTTCCVKIYADTNKNLGDNINGKIQQLET